MAGLAGIVVLLLVVEVLGRRGPGPP